MQQILLFLIFLGVGVSGLPALADMQNTPPKQELVFLNWSDYLDPEILKEFETTANVKVREFYFETDEARNEILLEMDATGYDLVIVDGGSIRKLAKRGWLEPLDTSAIANLKHLYPRWRTALPEAEKYGVPYFWGTLGIAYRKDLVPEPMTSWMHLFRPHESLRNKIVMIRNPADLIGMALKSLGYSANSTDRKALSAAEALLMQQKPFVKAYSYVALSEESALITGAVAAAMIYSGDALMLGEHDPNIVYAFPEEGSHIWVDYVAILSRSKNKALARKFINFLNEPRIAARNAQFVHYATPNKAAEAFLPAEYFQDPVIYPSDKALEKSEFYDKRFPSRVLRKRSAIFAQVVEEPGSP